MMNVKQMISAWISHRIEVVRARTRFELSRAEARAHILEGYLKALDHLDAIVKLIRSSDNRDEAKKGLIETYAFTDRQVNAVLDIRLYQLTGMEKEKIEHEYTELQVKIAHYRAILASETLVRGIIKDELDEVVKYDKTERKTQIVPAEEEFQMEDLIADEAMIITISDDDYIKRMPVTTFREQRRGGQGVIGFDHRKESDIIKDIYVASTHDTLMIFTNFGRVYWVKVWKIPEAGRRSKGRPLVNLLEGLGEGERIAAQLRVRNFDETEAFILLATKKGVVKKTLLEAFSSPRRKGVYAINIDEGDEVISAHVVREGEQIMLFTHAGMAVRFEQDEVRSIGRVARGVRGVRLKSQEDRVVSCEVVKGDETVLVVCENGFGKRSSVGNFRQTHRGEWESALSLRVSGTALS